MNLASSIIGDYIGLLNDSQIRTLAHAGMITPFSERVSAGLSYGLSPHGYDVRAGDVVLQHTSGFAFNTKQINTKDFVDLPIYTNDKGRYVALGANAFALLSSVETFDLPADITCEVWGKSTYARGGLHILVTPLEAGWRGQITIEITNLLGATNVLYLGEGIAQVRFHKCLPSESPYVGKYQGQSDITLPHVTK